MAVLKAFTSWRMFIVLLLGFSAGIPLALSGATLQAWMADEKIDLAVIGIFSLATMPYALKFLWAPLMDRFTLPFLGRRRGWMLVTQLALTAGIVALGFSNPSSNTAMTAFIAVLVAFFSSSQDIVVDAYRVEVLSKEEFGAGAAVYVLAYRLAMIVSGGGALILADQMAWQSVYLVMAGTMLLGIVASLFGPEPVLESKPPRSLTEAVVLPFVEFFKRPGAIETLLFLVLYKLDVYLTMALQTTFFMDIGFSKTEIGAITKVFGVIATMVGSIVGGGFMIKMGLRRSLWVFGVAQALSGLTYMLLAHAGRSHALLVAAIGVENLCSGMGIAAYSAFMMSLCDRRFTATQYALLSSLMGFARGIVQAPSGYMVKAFGWEYYFLICTLAGIPGLLLLLRYRRWSLPETQ